MDETIAEMELKEGLSFGWAKNQEIEEVGLKLELKYGSKFIKNIVDVDPIVLIDGNLYDGWKRCVLAYAIGQSEVLAACFVNRPRNQNCIYSTQMEESTHIRQVILNNNLSVIEELHAGGILFYFNNEEELLLVKNKSKAPS